jgi:hypothetical protein
MRLAKTSRAGEAGGGDNRTVGIAGGNSPVAAMPAVASSTHAALPGRRTSVGCLRTAGARRQGG